MMIKTSGYGSNCGASCVGSCGKNWETQENRCYYFSKGKLSWVDAEKFCQRNLGGQLASVTDTQGFGIINGKNAQVWIGGTSEPGNDTWVWTDCSPWGFTKWAGGEPKNWADKEKCAVQNAQHSSQKEWAVEECTDEYRFVCSTTVCSGKTQSNRFHLVVIMLVSR